MNNYNTDAAEWVEPPRQIIVTHVRASEHTFTPDPPQAGEGHASAAKALPSEADGRRMGPPIPGRRMGRKAPTKPNANRKSGLLANVATH